MLTGELIRPRLRLRGSTLEVETLDMDDLHWQKTASELITLIREQVGSPLSAWDTAVDDYLGERIDYVVVRGLAKVLSDAATFTPVATRILPVEIRERLFAQGPVFTKPDLFHPQTRRDVIRSVAKDLRIPQKEVESSFFADRPAEYILTDAGPAWTADDLLARYNLELSRGVLYWASHVNIRVQDNYKDLWRYLKLFKLMFWASPAETGYTVDLDGPISPFVRSTTRYGRQFAAFLPALLLGNRWQMTATIRLPLSQGNVTYRLDDSTPLRSHFKRSGLFDSRLEADFAAEFEEKFGGERGKWRLTREDEVILLGDTVMIPDFSFTHRQDGRRALLEIVGFWHPDYLRRKVEKVRTANRHNLILLVYEGVNLTEDKLLHIPGEVLYFKNKPVIKDVMAVVERVALL